MATSGRAWEAYRAKRMIIHDGAGFVLPPKVSVRGRRIATANYALSMSSAYLAVLVLAGCATATSDVGQVKEVGPGTYKIGVAHFGNSVLVGGTNATSAAIEQAGQYCHAKGQKLLIVPSADKDVTFRCGDTIKP
jgi:hypothetical protein